MSTVTHPGFGGGGQTRTFTDDELSVMIRALIAIRPHVNDDAAKIINGIIRDGWS